MAGTKIRSMNFYQLLGLDELASAHDIKKAYKKLALRYHPDKNFGTDESNQLFQEINRAYQILSNPESKRQYDQSLTSNHKIRSTDMSIDEAVKNCLKREEECNRVITSNLDKPNFKWAFILWIVFSCIVWIMTSPVASDAETQTERRRTESSNTVYAIEEVSVYTKPNIESDIKYTAEAGVGFIIIRKTKYFAYVSFTVPNAKTEKGYVLLDKLKSK